MYLDEILLCGAAKRPQTYGSYFAYNDNHEICSCAIGAINECLTNEPYYSGVCEMLLDHNIDISTMVKHPVTERKIELYSAIVNLNDEYRWTREQIAEWLKTIRDEIKAIK